MMILPVALIVLAAMAAGGTTAQAASPKALPSGGGRTPKKTPRKKAPPVTARRPRKRPKRKTRRPTSRDRDQAKAGADAIKRALGWGNLAKALKKAKAGAEALRKYLMATGNFGTRSRRDEMVKRAQRLMGFKGSKVDGMVGPVTRKAAAAVGVVLPARGSKKKKLRGWDALKLKMRDVKKVADRAADKATAAAKPKLAAEALKNFLVSGGSTGTKARPSGPVRAAQKVMGGLAADGIYGPNTQRRAKALGVSIPARIRL